MEAFLSSIEFKLPKVRFDWSVGPPPPPPAVLSVYDAILREDFEVCFEPQNMHNTTTPVHFL